MRITTSLLFSTILILWTGNVSAADWPMWRCEANRSAACAQELPATLHLQWVRRLPRLQTAWLDQPKLVFDRKYEPVVSGSTMYVGSSRDDALTAYDTRTGAEKWSFQAEGPIRFAPAAWKDRVFVASDDGYLYCVDAASGALKWKFRGGPADRLILGNERLIATWPARGGPVVADDIVYFAAGVWPFMGVFLHALDAETGKVKWTNDGEGSIYITQPHGANSFAGPAPQGALVVNGDKLIVPSSRSVPAVFDRETSKLLHYLVGANSKRGGGSDASSIGDIFINGGAVFSLSNGAALGSFSQESILTNKVIYSNSGDDYYTYDLAAAKVETKTTTDRRGRRKTINVWKIERTGAWNGPVANTWIKAGSRFYVGGKGQVAAITLPEGEDLEVGWQAKVDGTVVTMLAADDRLFAVTLEGDVYCFGAEKAKPRTFDPEPKSLPRDKEWGKKVETLLESTGVRAGYAVVWGAGTGKLIFELLHQSNLHLIVVEPDLDKAKALRRQLVDAGVYGERVSVHAAEPHAVPLPPYLASLIVAEDLASIENKADVAFLRKTFHSLRPYGGTACLPIPADNRARVAGLVKEAKLASARWQETPAFALLSRPGALPGAADWTHEHADAANTRVSQDDRVKLPLGILWFGGSSNEPILPRHGHGPQPQVIGGRLFIEGPDIMRALDIYTGRVLWEADLPGVGKFYNNTAHQPGANGAGANYISTEDGVYVAYGTKCVKLDPATGKQLAEFALPKAPGAKGASLWGYINVWDDYLIGGAEPLIVDPKENTLQVWDFERRRVIKSLQGLNNITGLAYSQDGKLLAAGGSDGTIKIWSPQTGKVNATWKVGGDVLAVAFSPDSKLLAVAQEDGGLELRGVDSGKIVHDLEAHKDDVRAVAFAPDGATLASAGADKLIVLWDVKSGEIKEKLRGSASVACVAFSPDSRKLVTGAGNLAVVWDARSGKAIDEFAGHAKRETIEGVAFSPDGKLIATACTDKTVKLWDGAGKLVKTLALGDDVICVAFAPKGNMLAAGLDDGRIGVCDFESGKIVDRLPTGAGSVHSLSFTSEGQLAVGGAPISVRRNESRSASNRLVIMNRHTGKVLWSVQAQGDFRHNAICVGGGRLFCIDRMPRAKLARLQRRGEAPDIEPRVLAFDMKTGKQLWSCTDEVFGTWLSFSAKHDILMEAGRPAGDSLADEASGMRAFNAKDGSILWANKGYRGPAMIHGDLILNQGKAYAIKTGAPKKRLDPVTGAAVEWGWSRNYGCNTPAAAKHLLTFRSGAAGFCDITGDTGTGNFGGFKSSCTNNLVVAGGLLNAPDYTRTCTCSYQNQASLALIHMPELEVWTRFPVRATKSIKHLALNLGAVGDRRSADGRLWLNEYDTVKITHDKSRGLYHHHSSRIEDSKHDVPWVAASGCRGIERLEVELDGDDEATYTVRLHFADPDQDKPGQRVFDVALQGKTVLKGLDIAKEAGGRNRPLVKEFTKLRLDKKLVLEFETKTEAVLSGVEIIRE